MENEELRETATPFFHLIEVFESTGLQEWF